MALYRCHVQEVLKVITYKGHMQSSRELLGVIHISEWEDYK